MSPYPHLLEPVTLAGVPLRNRVVMGSMHTGMEDRARHLPELAAYFAERARGGVGLIVTGGYAPNVRGWLLPFGSMMTRRAARGRAPPGHRRGAHRGRRDPAAGAARGPLRLHPAQRLGVRDQVADHAVQGRRPVVARGRADHRRLRGRGPAGPARRVRRHRGDGVRGVPHQPVPRPAHQPAHRPVGWLGGEPDALPRRGGPPGARGARRRLPADVPHVAARPRPRRPDLGRDRHLGPQGRGGRRVGDQHRHRLARGAGAHDHHPGPARRLGRDHRPAAARGRHPGVRLEPDQLPRGGRGDPRLRRRRPGLDGPAVPGRPGRWSTRPRPVAPTRSTPASAATRPAWTTRSPTSARPAWSTRGPAARPRWCSRPTRRARRVAVVGAGPAGLVRRRVGRRARARRDAVRGLARDRRPVPAGDGDPRQGGVRLDAALLLPPARRARGRRTPVDGGRPPTT